MLRVLLASGKNSDPCPSIQRDRFPSGGFTPTCSIEMWEFICLLDNSVDNLQTIVNYKDIDKGDHPSWIFQDSPLFHGRVLDSINSELELSRI